MILFDGTCSALMVQMGGLPVAIKMAEGFGKGRRANLPPYGRTRHFDEKGRRAIELRLILLFLPSLAETCGTYSHCSSSFASMIILCSCRFNRFFNALFNAAWVVYQ